MIIDIKKNTEVLSSNTRNYFKHSKCRAISVKDIIASNNTTNLNLLVPKTVLDCWKFSMITAPVLLLLVNFPFFTILIKTDHFKLRLSRVF